VFVIVAVIMPIFANGTEAGDAAWAWFAFFIINALIAAFTDVFVG